MTCYSFSAAWYRHGGRPSCGTWSARRRRVGTPVRSWHTPSCRTGRSAMFGYVSFRPGMTSCRYGCFNRSVGRWSRGVLPLVIEGYRAAMARPTGVALRPICCDSLLEPRRLSGRSGWMTSGTCGQAVCASDGRSLSGAYRRLVRGGRPTGGSQLDRAGWCPPSSTPGQWYLRERCLVLYLCGAFACV